MGRTGRPTPCFIDDTGGFGASWIDNLRRLGRDADRHRASPAAPTTRATTTSARRCISRRSTGSAAAARCRPQASHELIAALSQTTYSFRGDRLLLEPKEQVKARLGYSPDDADAFVLTFAQPVAARERYYDRTMEAVGMRRRWRPGRCLVEYDLLKGW